MPLHDDVRTTVWSSINNAVESIENDYKKQLQRLRSEADRERDKLKSTIAGLDAQVETLHDLIAENQSLRQAAAIRGDTGQFVHISLYTASQTSLRQHAANYAQANLQREKWKKKCHVYMDQRQRDKKSIKSWQDYHDALMTKRHDAQANLPELISAIESPPTAAQTPNRGGTASFTDIEHADDPTEPGLTSPTPVAAPETKSIAEQHDHVSMPPIPSAIHAPSVPSSQTTDADGERDAYPVDVQKTSRLSVGSGDEIQFVAVRSTKRKRTSSGGDPNRRPPKVTIVKDEGTSSPLHHSTVARLNHEESLDLDEVPPNFDTPRKRRLMEMQLRRSLRSSSKGMKTGGGPRRTRSSSEPPALSRHQSLQEQDARRPRFSERPPSIIPSPDYTGEVDNPVLPIDTTIEPAGPAQAIAVSTLPAAPRPAAILRPLDINRSGSRASVSKAIDHKIKLRSSFGGIINEFSEDGDAYSSRSWLSAPPAAISGPTTTGRRLNGLLETPSSPNPNQVAPLSRSAKQHAPDKDALAVQVKVSPASHPSETRSHELAQLTTPLRPLAVNKRMSLATEHTPQVGKLKTPSTSARSKSSTSKTQVSLRKTPVTALKSSDFRINPAANHGHDHAFTDVVRGRQARQCLPGCTDPSCCGDKFRKMVEIGGVSKRPRGMFDLPSSQDDPDDALLRDYMGHNLGIIPTLSGKARDDLLIKARAAELSGQIGRHKAQWQRAKSPPGYWRTDFPTTQEAEVDKKDASNRERELVEERRREAMRPGGKWLFADEQPQRT